MLVGTELYHGARATVDYKVTMSRSLLLLRHAKASPDSESGADFDRPLSKRGFRDATAMAELMRKEIPKPDLVLCSTALRTRQTLDAILAVWPSLNVRFERDLYLASPYEAERLVRSSGDAQSTLIIAHNPMTEMMLHQLVDINGDNDKAGLADASIKYPTGALSVLSLEIDAWEDLKRSCGTLKLFVKPRALSDETV